MAAPVGTYDPAFASAGVSLAPHAAKGPSGLAAASKAARVAIPNLVNNDDPMALTPLRAHYLKKTLIKLQMEKEVAELSTRDALSTFGPPFKPSPRARTTDLPLLRYLFQHFVLTFPFLRSAPPNFFADKVQVFVDRFLEKNISGTDDRAETTKRRRLGSKLEKYFVLLMGSAIKVKCCGEEVVKIGERDRQKMSALESRRRAALGRAAVSPAASSSRPNSSHSNSSSSSSIDFDINVVSIRTVTKKGRLRSRSHEEFIIRTRRGFDLPPIYVSRRYGDFARLADTLKLEFPEEEIRPPPPKDRSTMDIGDVYQPPPPPPPPKDGEPSSYWGLNMPSLGYGTQAAAPEEATAAEPKRTTGATNPTGTLAREKNRLTLRAYLRSLLAIPPVADSAVFMDFLTEDPVTLTPLEEEDVAVREGLDHVREEEHRRFAEESSRRVQELQQHLAAFKADLIQRDGLTRIFATIKSTPRLEDLPEKYRALMKWARISLASSLFHIFLGSDTSSEIFGQLKRMHGLMPYFMLRGILRVSNPVAMIRGVLDLFLAQPFGQRSLLQRMFSSSLQDEVKEITEICQAISAKVDDPLLCEKVRSFVYAPSEIQEIYRQDAEQERLDLLTCILRSPEAPALNRSQIHRVVKASQAYEVYKEYRRGLKNPELEDEGPQDEDAWLYEDLHVLMKMLTRQRDKEQMIALIFEGVTAELLKDMVTIFYSPLAQVYKAANIADSLSDLQAFINDLIKTVESSEELSYTDPQRTVQVFIDLVERHESKFYDFVHQVHSKGSGLFDGLMHWIELFINFIRGDNTVAETDKRPGAQPYTGGGIGAVDLEVCLPAGGDERRQVLEEIDSLVLHAYRLKFLREVKLRRKLADREVAGAANKLIKADNRMIRYDGLPEDDDRAFVGAMIENLGVGDMFTGEVAEAEADDDEYTTDEDSASDEDGEELSSALATGEPVSRKKSKAAYSESETETEDEDGADAVAEDAEDAAELSPKPASTRWKPSMSRQATLMPSNGGSATPTMEKELPSVPLTLTADGAADGKKVRRGRLGVPTTPELKLIPEMVPLFVEMVRPLLRPARTASATSYTSGYDPYRAGSASGTGQPSGAPPSRIQTDRLDRRVQDMNLVQSPSMTTSASQQQQQHQQGGEEPATSLPGGYRW
ncbi:hypothetical protein ACQY0O_008280 [Thecaphora frezii]